MHSIYKRKDSDDLVTLETFDQLEGDDKDIFDFILRLAFTATVNSKQVFSCSEKESEGDDNKLGLIVVDRDYVRYGLDEIYTFLHLTFQEYLAACYVARLSVEFQKQIIQSHGKKKHLAVVWKFYCGMTIFSDKALDNFKLLLSQTESNTLLHLQCAHESQQKCTCTHVVQSKNGEIKLEKESLNPVDCTALGYVLINSDVPVKTMTAMSCHMGPESFAALVKESGTHSLLIEFLRLVF